jgi:hypothetical protein
MNTLQKLLQFAVASLPKSNTTRFALIGGAIVVMVGWGYVPDDVKTRVVMAIESAVSVLGPSEPAPEPVTE